MHLLLVWNRYICIAVLICNVNADRRTFNDTQVSRMQELLDNYCPNHIPFTCTEENSTKATKTCCVERKANLYNNDSPDSAPSVNVGTRACSATPDAINGCSCDQSCGLYGNCCYNEDDVYNLMEEGMMKCSFPYTGRPKPVLGNTMYKLIVSPPKGGCVAPGSCNETTQLIPWDTFYPVFSKVKKQSYINPDCAACHGVLDGTKWNSLIIFGNFKSGYIDEITVILMARESDQISVYFEHPGTDLEIMQSMCSTRVREVCNPLNGDSSIEKVRNFETILPHLHITFDEMISGCYDGPYSLYLHHGRWYKNLFCVICHDIKSPTDRCIPKGVRSQGAGLAVLIDFEYIDIAKKDSLRKRILNSKIACKAGTKRECRPVLCPTLQMRVKSGECKFLSTRWNLAGIQLSLNLTATASMGWAETIFFNHSKSDILGVLYDKTPWHKCWTIHLAGIRSFPLRNKTVVEMLIEMVCQIAEVSPSLLINRIQNAMSMVWTIKTDIGLLRFHQEFYKYGGMKNSEGVLILINNVFDGFVSPMVEIPRYLRVYNKDGVITKTQAYVVINKLFYCHQIELKPHEYELRNVLRLIFSDKFLFFNEYIVSYRFDDLTVRLCLEDFDMELVPNGVRARCISELLIIVGMLYTTLLK